VTTRFLKLVATLALGTTGSLHAQTPLLNRNIIVLDPAHGGLDTGARLSEGLTEKQVTLAFAARLRPMLAAAGFNVVATRDADPAEATPLTADQRAGTANHVHALACILLHATLSGTGAHIFTSALAPSDPEMDSAALPWASAQASYIPLSLRLANELGVSLLHANISPLLGHASIRPIDNLTCPAVALELAPLLNTNSDSTPVYDPAYQQRAAQAITDALVSWRNHAVPPATPAGSTTKPATKPLVTPSPKGGSEPKATPTPKPAPATPKPAITVPKPATAAPKPLSTPTPTAPARTGAPQ
jgi:N-acetylmuramoyl-L-alanine amidase